MLRLDNFGPGGVSLDLFETGLPPAQWSDIVNADIRDGDLCSAGSDDVVATAPIVPLYPYLYESGGLTIYVVSDGTSIYAKTGAGDWQLLGEGLTPGRVSYTVFRGCLIINTAEGPYYWCDQYGEVALDTWEEGPVDSWETGNDVEWDEGLAPDLDSWASGSAAAWDAEDNVWDDILSTAVIVPLPDWPAGATALQIIAYKDQLVALAVVDPSRPAPAAPYLVLWSALAPAGSVPSQWAPQEGNFAGDVRIQDTQGTIAGGALLRDDLIIYKTDSIWRLSATFNPDLPMRLERVVTCAGIESPDALTTCSDVHFLLTKKGFAVFDGNQVRYLDFLKIQSDLLRRITGNIFSAVKVGYFGSAQEVWMLIKEPLGGNEFTTLVKWSRQHDSFTIHDYRGKGLVSLAFGYEALDELQEDETWESGSSLSWDTGTDIPWTSTSPSSTTESAILGFSSKALARYNINGFPEHADGTPKPAVLTRYGVMPTDGWRSAAVRRIFPEMEGDGATFELGTSWEVASRDLTWHPARSFAPGYSRQIPYHVTGNKFALRVTSKNKWRLHAVSLDVVEGPRA